jgi:uncharacterized surface protein with fasciclin (FAS1) repeats
MKLIKVVFFFLLFSGLGITGCKKGGLEEPPGITVLQIITTDSKYTLLNYALQRTGYRNLLATTPNITLFAPSDAAFTAAGLATTADIDALNIDFLKYFIGYHLSGRSVPTSKILANGRLETLSNYIFTSSNTTGLFINAIPLPVNYTAAANGVIYPLTSVLQPPTNTLQGLINSDTSLSLFARAIAKDSLAIALVSDLTNLYTLFAPVNNAFRARNIYTNSEIDALGKEALDTLIKHHLISSSHILSTDFINGNRIKNMRDSSLYTGVAVDAKGPYLIVPYQSTTTPVYFLKKDSIAVNGTIYRIEKLLSP